ncbi:MAG: tetratricopeptide repeat-containing diguanylate cyclase [Lachnospiraceae bacterium]|uniref:tetratricopeptide repeat-containing diguanylate cyclase n=1 Tax=Roseburia hominis TaxID=301301 RepID=UPI001F2E769B|nr:GGDEF domain-containing protein [Roseburia hominis]MDY4838316.1 tetratricopeptide repeat-containing diguanylate cyclase [Lachnospiraceae bacterium]
MIEKYYGGMIEQVFGKIGSHSKNMTLAKYSNDFSVQNVQWPEKIREQKDVFIWEHEFVPGNMSGPYEPFLDIIGTMFHEFYDKTLEDFLEENDIYYLQRSLIRSYIENGQCEREEQLIFGEIKYEQERMQEGILRMLISLSKKKPCLIILNRIQFAAGTTLALLNCLFESPDAKNIGVVLGENDLTHIPEHVLPVWETLVEKLKDENQVLHIGTTQCIQKEQPLDGVIVREEVLPKITNLVQMMDFSQALFYLNEIERRIKFESFKLENDLHFLLWEQYCYAAFFSMDLSKTLEICEEIASMQTSFSSQEQMFFYYYLTGNVFMYQGRLFDAVEYAKKSQQYAKKIKDDKRLFLAELLETQARMSGWYNIFFCAQNIDISDELIEKLIQYNYKNHLAYVYVYAYDNKPEIVAKAYQSEAQLIYFSKGVALAKEIGNQQLVYSAYQKNIMLASANGMYEIALLYSVRTYESVLNKNSQEVGRIYSGLGYNLSALGRTKDAEWFYKKAIQIFYDLRLPEDIAEVFYNMSLNYIQMGEYKQASEYLMICMKTIEKLHLNSLRVCNVSKLYGLLALCSVLMGNQFNCERYLLNCKQFLNYVLEKSDADEIGSVHDYAKCDDDLFLYYFSQALLDVLQGKEKDAAQNYTTAEHHLRQAQGNQSFCYCLFRESRIRFYESMGRLELRDNEQALLLQYKETMQNIDITDCFEKIKHAGIEREDSVEISLSEIDALIRQEGISRAYQQKKHQMNFISSWQKMIDVSDVSVKTMMQSVMKTFLYHFSVDKALYIRYQDEKPQILFDNTERKITVEKQRFIKKCFTEDPRGFVVSKISSNYSAHQNIISLFGEDNVCSMVAIPFMNNGKLESVLIVYVLMKDNWHSSVNRYMLDEDDRNLYELLFREVQYSLNRLDAYEKIYEMNTKLYESAITDQLTGIYNRKGFYLQIEEIMGRLQKKKQKRSFALMFIDLDNFKGYNDTFGHDVGDLILKEMAGIFKEVCGKEGFVSRYGGDEFIVFVKNNKKQVLEQMAQQIYGKIAEKDGFRAEIERNLMRKIELNKDKQISCSIGIAGSDEVQNEEDINRLIKKADDLLYQIKTTGKGRYIFI